MTPSTSFIPSAQVIADGEPRFHVPASPEHVGWASAVAMEEAGGVAAEVRAFFDAQLASGDVVVDVAPGFGFVALSATTAPGGMPTVFVAGLSDERLQALQDAAVDVGGWLDELPISSLPELSSVVDARLEPEGRVFIHADCANLTALATQLQPLLAADRVLAICLGDAALASDWSSTAAQIDALGFRACGIVEQHDELVLVPIDGAPVAPVIALPAALIGNA